MDFKNSHGALALSLFALTACSSGGALGPAPVFAPPLPVLPTDYDGKTFPVRYFGIENSGGTVSRFRGTGTANFISEEEITLTINGRTYAFVDTIPIDGGFEDGAATAEFNDFSANVIGFDGSDATSSFIGAFGFQTDPADMPSGAVPVIYSSVDTSALYVYTPGIGGVRSGDVFLVVNFDADTITGEMFRDSDFVMSIEGGTISGNSFNGTVSATYDDGGGGGFVPVTVANSDVDGWFHGNTASDMMGTYEGDFPTPVAGSITGFAGGFLATD